jgi:hypothetical protein
LALRSDAVKHLQQHGTQKLLWGDGGSTALALSFERHTCWSGNPQDGLRPHSPSSEWALADGSEE